MSSANPVAAAPALTLPGRHEAGPQAVQLLKALNHPVRRDLLRRILDAGPVNYAEARAAVSSYFSASLVNFHLTVLVETGAAVREKVGDAKGSQYRHTEATEADWVLRALQLTALED